MSNKPYERRAFVKQLAAISLGAPLARPQQPSAPPTPPKRASVTSSLMIWTLKGNFEEKISKAAAAGIQSVELVSEHEGWSDAEAAKNRSLVESYGMRIDTFVGSHDWSKRPVSMVNPAHREAFLADVKHAIAWAKKLDSPQIILMSGNEQPGMTQEAQFASLVEAGKQAVELAQAADVTLILENLNSKVNHPGYFLTSAAESLKAVKQVDHPRFRMLFDIYHEYVQHGDPIPVINEAEPYVAVFHVADAPGRHDPGTGTMKWDDIYTSIGKLNYAGYIALEYTPTAEDQVASLIKAVTQMRKALNAAQVPATATMAQ